MSRPSRHREPLPPLDAAALDRLAIAYVGRYATTRAKLAAYLRRKIGERGAATGLDPARIVERMATLGYVDDAAFADARAAALARRGYGGRRVDLALRAAGIEEDLRADALAPAAAAPLAAALAFARRRRLGPYAGARAAGPDRRKAIAAFARAGHDIDVARALVDLEPGQTPPNDGV